MSRGFAFILAIALLLTGGVVHGLYADRWQQSSALEDAITRIPEVPLEIAGWVGEDTATDAAEFAQAGALGYWSRMYRKDGKEILVILMAGRAGRMSIHTPEVCYRGAGFEIYGRPMIYTVRNGLNEELGTFWSANFLKPGAVNTELQLYWAWSDGALWQAPQSPRWTFAGQPALYKLYLSQNVTGLFGDVPSKIRADFFQNVLPVLNQALRVKP